MDGLDVEGLLAVPAGRAALLDVRVVLGQHLGELAPAVAGVTVAGGVLARVLGDGRRGVGVGDRDGDALAGPLLRPVGGAQLLAGVALDRVRRLAPVGGRQLLVGLGAVVRGERAGVAEDAFRRRQFTGVMLGELGRVVQAGDRQDRVGQGGGRGGGGRGRVVSVPALEVVVQVGGEGALGGGRVTLDRHIPVGGPGDRQAGLFQPVGHPGYLVVRGAVAGAHLGGAQVLPVRGGVRVGHRLRVVGEALGVAAGQVDAGGDGRGGGGGALVGLSGGPQGLGALQRVPTAVVARGVGGGAPSASAPATSGSVAAQARPARARSDLERLDLM